jgi:hypothetical protein
MSGIMRLGCVDFMTAGLQFDHFRGLASWEDSGRKRNIRRFVGQAAGRYRNVTRRRYPDGNVTDNFISTSTIMTSVKKTVSNTKKPNAAKVAAARADKGVEAARENVHSAKALLKQARKALKEAKAGAKKAKKAFKRGKKPSAK